MMSINQLKFTKDWTNPSDFPTFQENEEIVRRDMQLLHNEAKNHINNVLKPAIDELQLREEDLSADQHAHSNKTLLDAYTQTNSNIKDAVSKKHTHENKSVLDAFNADQLAVLASIIGVTQTLGDATDKVPSEKAVSDAMAKAGSLPGGGEKGEALVKKSNKALDVEWAKMLPFFEANSTDYDMDEILKGGAHYAAYRVGENTKGTPAKYGKTQNSYGIIFSVANGTNYGHQLAIVAGAPALFHRRLNSALGGNNISEWLDIFSAGNLPTCEALGAAKAGHTHTPTTLSGVALEKHTHTPDEVGALPITGGKASGNLEVERPQGALADLYLTIVNGDTTNGKTTAVSLRNQGTAAELGIRNQRDSIANLRSLYLRSSANTTDINRAIQLRDTISNTSKYYRLFGEHNKPEGSYTGTGKAKTVSVGGIGQFLLVQGPDDTGLVTPLGSFAFPNSTRYDDSSVIYRFNGDDTYADGVLNLSGGSYLNYEGDSYNWKLL